MDQARIDFDQRGMVDAEPFGNARTEAFDDDVCILHQLMANFLPLGAFEIKRNAALVSVGAEKDGAIMVRTIFNERCARDDFGN